MKIPFAEVQTESPGAPAAPPQIDTAHLPGMAAAGAGAMAETVGKGITTGAVVADRILAAREQVEISNATTEAAGKLAEARIELEKDPDVAGRLAKFQTQSEQIKQQYLPRFTSAGASEFGVRYNQLYKPFEINVRQDARTEEIQKYKLDLGDSLDKMATQAIFAKSPIEREAIQAEADKQITQAVNTGYLKASDAAQLKRTYLGNVDKALAAEQVRLNPGAAIVALGNPNMFPNLDAAARVQLRAAATQHLQSQSVAANAELRYDAAEFLQATRGVASGGPPTSEAELNALVKRAGGPNSRIGVKLREEWGYYNDVSRLTAGKTPDQIRQEIQQLRSGQGSPKLGLGMGFGVGEAPTGGAAPPIAGGEGGGEQPYAPPREPTAEELRKARDLERILKLKVEERDRDPVLHERVNQMLGAYARAAGGQPMPSEAEYKAMIDAAGGEDTANGTRLRHAHDLAKDVHKDATLPLDQLQDRIYQLREQGGLDISAQPTAQNLERAHALELILKERTAQRDRDPRLHMDINEMMTLFGHEAGGGPKVDESQYKDLLERAGGPNTALGANLERAHERARTASRDVQGLSIPESQRRIAELRGAPSEVNLEAARTAGLIQTPQEEALYRRHLANVVGPGGVTQPGGERSTLEVMTMQGDDGRTYLVPTIWDGKELTGEQAEKRAREVGLEQFPSYATRAEADRRYEQIHQFMAQDIRAPTPAELHEANVLQTGLEAREKARKQDPAAYTQQLYPTIAADLDTARRMAASNDPGQQAQASVIRSGAQAAFIDAQKREGVPDHEIALLTKPQAEAIYAQLTTAPAQQRADLVTSLREQYGPYWPEINRQLSKDHALPPDIEILASLPTSDDANLVKSRLVAAVSLKPSDVTQQLGETTVKDIKDAVRTATAELATTMNTQPDGPRHISTWQTGIARLAELYMIQGETNASKAVRRATDELFNNNWKVSDQIHGISFRIPKVQGEPVVDPGDARRAVLAVIDQLPNMNLVDPGGLPGTTPAQRKQMLIDNVKSFGFAVNTGDEKGVVLMAGNGRPVLLADRQTPIVISWDTVRAIAKERAAARAIQIEESTRGMGEEVAPRTEPAVRTPPAALQRFFTQPPPTLPSFP